jgi:hypothetical protein
MGSMLFIIVGLILMGGYFIWHGTSRELRQRRADPQDDPVIRSARVDKLVKVACFTLGGLFLAVGLFILVVFFKER